MTIMTQYEKSKTSGASIMGHPPNFGQCEIEIGLLKCVCQGSQVILATAGMEVLARLVKH